jgi:histone H2A
MTPLEETTAQQTKATETTKDKVPRVSRSTKAGLRFPVGRVESKLRKTAPLRVSFGAPIFLAAVLEYLTAELLEVSVERCTQLKRHILTAEHVQYALKTDDALYKATPAGMAISNSKVFEADTIAIRIKRMEKRKANEQSRKKRAAKKIASSKETTPATA